MKELGDEFAVSIPFTIHVDKELERAVYKWMDEMNAGEEVVVDFGYGAEELRFKYAELATFFRMKFRYEYELPC